MSIDERAVASLEGIVARRLTALRHELRARYGWTRLELSLDFGGQALVVRGEIAVPSLCQAIDGAIRPMLIEGMELDLRLRPLRVREWYAVPTEGLELWAQHPSSPRRSLATELERGQGPIGELARDGHGVLLRARDGTVGWATAKLGEARPARPLRAAKLGQSPRRRICAAARAYLGTPYVLGGASRRRIDCSALVQRACDHGLGLLLPRNSHDQLAIAGGGRAGEPAVGEPGDLVFIRSRTMQRLHVGLVCDGGTIIHASRSRAAVIEEPQVEFQLDAEWLRHVSLTQLVSWGRTQAGRDYVELPARAATARAWCEQ